MNNKDWKRGAAFAVTVAALTLLLATQTGAATAGFALQVPGSFPINATNWIPLAFVAVMLVIAVAGFVYILGGFLNSGYPRAWAQSQVAQAVLSLILLFIFVGFAYLFLLDPQVPFSSAGLVPTTPPPGCSSANTIFTLASCDISYFSASSFNATTTVYVLGFLASFSPGIAFNYTLGVGVGVTSGLPDFVPVQEEELLGTGFGLLFFALILNQLQVILLAGSLLWLSLFLTIGLVARCFGVTRAFGGTMIALGLALGLVYPLLVTVTYGYIDGGISALGGVSLAANMETLPSLLFSAVAAFLSGVSGNPAAALFSEHFLKQVSYIFAGLTFIPFINFTILDAFIRDFSRAIGQQIDFMSLLGGLI